MQNTLFLGWLAKKVGIMLIGSGSGSLFFTAGTAFVFYVLMIGMFFWTFPWITGFKRDELLRFIKNPLVIFSSR